MNPNVRARLTSFTNEVVEKSISDVEVRTDDYVAVVELPRHQAAATGAQLVWRTKTNAVLPVLIGLAVSVPIVIWGSTLVLKWVERYPAITWLGAASSPARA